MSFQLNRVQRCTHRFTPFCKAINSNSFHTVNLPLFTSYRRHEQTLAVFFRALKKNIHLKTNLDTPNYDASV